MHLKLTSLISGETATFSSGFITADESDSCARNRWIKLRAIFSREIANFDANDGEIGAGGRHFLPVTASIGGDVKLGSFRGCAKGVKINGFLIDESRFAANGAVYFNACPR